MRECDTGGSGHGRGAQRCARRDRADGVPQGVLLLHGERAHGQRPRRHGRSQLRGRDREVVRNGGSDLLYVPSGDPELVHNLVNILTQLDYISGIFVDDHYCATPAACPGALRLSDIGLMGTSKVPRPAVVVSFKEFYRTPGNLLSGVQVADTVLQEGQGNHGGFGRDQTLNNMAAIGPDFRPGIDSLPMGNIDIAPTVAHIMGFSLPSVGKVKGRILEEAFPGVHEGAAQRVQVQKSHPAANGLVTLMEYQEQGGVRYLDRACMVAADASRCGS